MRLVRLSLTCFGLTPTIVGSDGRDKIKFREGGDGTTINGGAGDHSIVPLLCEKIR